MPMMQHSGYADLGNPIPRDTRVLDNIASVMNGQVWSPDTLSLIADILRAAGRPIVDSSTGIAYRRYKVSA